MRGMKHLIVSVAGLGWEELERRGAARAAGLEFRVWGVNDAELFAYVKSLKVAVFTCANWRDAFEWAKAHPDVEMRP